MNDNVVPIRVGSGVNAVEATSSESELTVPEEMVPVSVVDSLRQEMQAAVADIEFRLGQQYALMRRAETDGGSREKVFVEDIVDQKHRMTGYSQMNNSNGTVTTNGSIAWKFLHIVLLGVDYTIADGTTANKYAWFVKPGSGTTATLVTGNSVPLLGPNDSLIFVNNGGTLISALESALPAALYPGTVTEQMLASDVNAILSGLNTDLQSVQDQADGAITSYFQNDPPWGTVAGPNTASPSEPADQGDIWYDSNDGGAYRWSGALGTPANSWVRIADTDTSALAAKVDTKVTTYVGLVAPTAPAGGFTAGDIWIDTATGNVVKRWTGATPIAGQTANSWHTMTVGDAAIATGITAGKISGTLAVANIPTLDITTKTSGTIVGTRIGTGIAGANLVAGSVTTTQIGDDAITNAKIGVNAVGTTEIAADAVTNDKIGLLAVGTAEIAADAVTNAKIGALAVGTTEIADDAITNLKIGPLAVTNTELATNAVQPKNINAAFHLLY